MQMTLGSSVAIGKTITSPPNGAISGQGTTQLDTRAGSYVMDRARNGEDARYVDTVKATPSRQVQLNQVTHQHISYVNSEQKNADERKTDNVREEGDAPGQESKTQQPQKEHSELKVYDMAE